MPSDSTKSINATLRRHLLVAGAFFLLGILYLIWLKLTGIGIPCVFRLVTGLRCPGCGVTTMLLALTEGRFDLARHVNPFLFYTGPLLLLFLIWNEIKTITGKKGKADRIVNILLIAYLIALIVFGVVRNIGVTPHFVWQGASLHCVPGTISRYLP